MRFLGELAQARNDGIDIERASTTWSTSSFTSYHGQLLSLAVQNQVSHGESDHRSLMLGEPPAAYTVSLSAARRPALNFTVHSVKPEWAAPSPR